jgi:hypothetical protein
MSARFRPPAYVSCFEIVDVLTELLDDLQVILQEEIAKSATRCIPSPFSRPNLWPGRGSSNSLSGGTTRDSRQ